MFTLHTYKSIARAILTKRSPYYIQFYVNGRCNLMCRQCNIVETNSRIPEMSLADIRRVATNLSRIGAGIVLLTGGEPFLRDDLPEIVQIFVERGLNVRLQTAGSKVATEARLRACYDAGARDINVSVDSLDFATGDYINAVPGSAQRAIETIETISHVFRDKSAILSLGTVLSPLNYKEIPAIVELARRIGWYVSLVPAHIASVERPRGFQSFDDMFTFPAALHSELDAVAQQLVSMKREGWPLFDSERFLRSAVSFLKGDGASWRVGGICDSPDLYFAIRPNGEFTTCCDFTLRDAPTVQDDSFPKAFSSGAIRNRPDVQQIVKSCDGCHYGSYPEVTLATRDMRIFLERAMMVLRSGPGRLRAAETQAEFVTEIDRVKAQCPNVYPVAQWQQPAIADSVRRWAASATRRQMLVTDNARRDSENRRRGRGDEPMFMRFYRSDRP